MGLWKGYRIAAAAVCGLLVCTGVQAQQAREYFPHQPGASWLYDVTFTSADTTLLHYQRTDSVVHVESAGESDRVFVRSDGGPVAQFGLSGDTIKVGPSALGLEPILDVIGIPVDDDAFAALDAFRLSAPLEQPWTIRTVSRRVAVPDDLRDTFAADSVDVTIRIRGMRLPDEQITTPLGALTARTFLTYLRLSIRIQFGIFPITVHLIDELVLRSHLATEYGIVLQHSDSYDVSSPLNPDQVIFTIPAQDVEMVEFRHAPAVSAEAPGTFPDRLVSVYPNPFNPSATIRLHMPEGAHVRLEVFTPLGELVTVLNDGYLPGGLHVWTWNARGLASGTYFLRATVNGERHHWRMTLAR